MKNSSAGTLESGDILVQIEPSQQEGIEIELQSPVAAQFGRQIRTVIEDTLKELKVNNVYVKAVDKGALDCTIRARVAAAAVRSTGKDIWKD